MSVLSIVVTALNLVRLSRGLSTTTGVGSIVDLGYATFQGGQNGNTTEFLGVPFAAPPFVRLPCLLSSAS